MAEYEDAPIVEGTPLSQGMSADAPTPPPDGVDVDRTTGAPTKVRALVGLAHTDEDRLTTLRGFYPDARPSFPETTERGNFLFTNPDTGKLTFYNPPGFGWRDVPSVGREVAQGVGGTAGAIGGFVTAGPPGAVAGAAAGAAGGEEAATFIGQQFGTADTRTMGERLRDTRNIAALEGVGQLVAPGAGHALRAGTKAVIRGGRGGRRHIQGAIDDLSHWGAHPSTAQATESLFWDSVEQLASSFPGGSGAMRKAVTRTMDGIRETMERRVATIAHRVAPDPSFAGARIAGGIEKFVGRWKDASAGLYTRLDAEMPPNMQVVVTNTHGALSALASQFPESEGLNKLFSNPFMKEFMEAIPAGGIVTYRTLSKIRTAVGQKLADTSLVSDVPRGELKRVYAALSQDIEVAAREGGPEAMRLLKNASNYYQAGIARIDDILEPLIRKNTPEQLFLAVEAGVKRGPTIIRALRRSLTPEEYELTVASLMRRLGRAPPGQQDASGQAFSLFHFGTNWSKIDEPTRRALFDAPGLRMFGRDIDALANAAERAKSSSQAFANPSGTASRLTGQFMILGAMGGIVSMPFTGLGGASVAGILALTAVGTHYGTRLMTSKAFVHWLAGTTRPAFGAKGAAGHLGRLSMIAANEDAETREAILAYLSVWERATTDTGEADGN